MHKLRLAKSAWLVFAGAACSSSKLTAPSDAGSAAPGATPPAVERFTLLDAARVSSDPNATNFQRQLAELDFDGGPFTRATLVADLGTTCFPFESWTDNPPPKGENWPADCDAFDRNFELSLDDAGDAPGSPPALELVRAITPFGGPMHLERDFTAVANALPGHHTLQAHIGTWSDAAGLVTGSAAGWSVTVTVELERGPVPERPLAVVPLFYGDLTVSEPLDVSFTAPEGTRRAYLEYRTTGHGAVPTLPVECAGPAEEFCKRVHTVKLDGTTLKSFAPFRSCASECTIATTAGGMDYCAQNPCGAIASVRAPRANWCPGSETAPIVLEAPELSAEGSHVITLQVSEIAKGGSVRASLIYYAFAD